MQQILEQQRNHKIYNCIHHHFQHPVSLNKTLSNKCLFLHSKSFLRISRYSRFLLTLQKPSGRFLLTPPICFACCPLYESKILFFLTLIVYVIQQLLFLSKVDSIHYKIIMLHRGTLRQLCVCRMILKNHFIRNIKIIIGNSWKKFVDCTDIPCDIQMIRLSIKIYHIPGMQNLHTVPGDVQRL